MYTSKYDENRKFNENEFRMLLQSYSNKWESLLKCEVTKELSILRKITKIYHGLLSLEEINLN